jgi:Spy/CpxP family protein refolding chaperone
MKKMTFLTISVILLLVLNAVTLFILFHMHLRNGHGPHGEDGKGPADYIVKQLKLDEQQQHQFEDLKDQHHALTHDAEKEDERLHDLYFSMLKSDAPDKNKVDSVANLIGEQRKKLATATFDHFRQLRAICHDDQKKLFDNTIDEIARMVTGHPDGPPPPR